MRIGFVSTLGEGAWGGSEALWVATAEHLLETGTEVVCNLSAWRTPPAPVARLAEHGCRVSYRTNVTVPQRLRVRALNRLKSLVGRGGTPPAQLTEKEILCGWLETEKPDLVLISQGYHLEGVAFKLACREVGVPYAVVVHSAGECGWPGDDYAEQLVETYAAAARCYFVSHGTLDFTRRVLATPFTDARIVRNPFNVPYTDEPLPWPDHKEEWNVAVVGRLECVQKGQDLLIEALRGPEWRDRPIRFRFFGKGPNEGRLRALAAMYGVTNVEFCGHTSDVAGIWRQCHALMMPSRYEGLPLTVVEAMLCGRPCIVTDVMGNAELVEDGVTGFVAAAATPRHLSETLERAWQGRSQWEDMGKRGAEAVRRQIPPDPAGVFARELLELAEGISRAR